MFIAITGTIWLNNQFSTKESARAWAKHKFNIYCSVPKLIKIEETKRRKASTSR